jgi:hypothetical protein
MKYRDLILFVQLLKDSTKGFISVSGNLDVESARRIGHFVDQLNFYPEIGDVMSAVSYPIIHYLHLFIL